jgi:hypothetical protein
MNPGVVKLAMLMSKASPKRDDLCSRIRRHTGTMLR